MAEEKGGSVDEDLNQRQCYQKKLHAKGSGPPKIRPVSPDAQLAHVEPLRKNARSADFWA
jgi:hypothetical protein